MFRYGIGVIRTVEKRFGLRSAKTGLVMSLNDIVETVLVIIVGYIGRKTHKPRYISIAILFSGLGGILCAMPYFIYGPQPIDPALISSMTTLQNDQPHLKPTLMDFQMCDKNMDINVSSTECAESEEHIQRSEANHAAFIFLMLASCCFGFGLSGLHTLGMSFLDENIDKEDSALYIGKIIKLSFIIYFGGDGHNVYCFLCISSEFTVNISDRMKGYVY